MEYFAWLQKNIKERIYKFSLYVELAKEEKPAMGVNGVEDVNKI